MRERQRDGGVMGVQKYILKKSDEIQLSMAGGSQQNLQEDIMGKLTGGVWSQLL